MYLCIFVSRMHAFTGVCTHAKMRSTAGTIRIWQCYAYKPLCVEIVPSAETNGSGSILNGTGPEILKREKVKAEKCQRFAISASVSATQTPVPGSARPRESPPETLRRPRGHPALSAWSARTAVAPPSTRELETHSGREVKREKGKEKGEEAEEEEKEAALRNFELLWSSTLGKVSELAVNEEALSLLSQDDDTATDLGRGGFPGADVGSRRAGAKLYVGRRSRLLLSLSPVRKYAQRLH